MFVCCLWGSLYDHYALLLCSALLCLSTSVALEAHYCVLLVSVVLCRRLAWFCRAASEAVLVDIEGWASAKFGDWFREDCCMLNV